MGSWVYRSVRSFWCFREVCRESVCDLESGRAAQFRAREVPAQTPTSNDFSIQILDRKLVIHDGASGYS